MESSTKATIHITRDYFLALLYHKLEGSPKKGTPTCKVFNEFVGNFGSKLLTLLDLEQFFLWAVAAALDGREGGFDWSKPVWDHDSAWPNVTYKYPTFSKLKAEPEKNIAKQVIFYLVLCMSFPCY